METKEGLGCIGVFKEITKQLISPNSYEFSAKEINVILDLSPRAIRRNLTNLELQGLIMKCKDEFVPGKGREVKYKLNFSKLFDLVVGEENEHNE